MLFEEQMMTKARAVTGQVTAVQEERLRLRTVSGQSLLLTLGKNTRLAAGLGDLLHTQALVRVEYTGEPNLACAVVRKIARISEF